MNKEVFDAIRTVFPEAEFKLEWGCESRAPEWGSLDSEPRKRAFRVTHLENDEQQLVLKARELEEASSQEESVFRIYEQEPTVDYDPVTKWHSLTAIIFFD